MSVPQSDSLLQVETTCGSLLYELQIIWDEVGESDTERDKMLLELEQECLEVYRRKVDTANRCRAHLKQGIADAEAELAAICSAMGERPVHIRQSDQSPGSLKAELRTILPQLEEMQKRKLDRRNQFFEVLEQILKIKNEIYRPDKLTAVSTVVDETDLSLRKLEELHRELQSLQKEKSDRLKQVLDYLNSLSSLCLVLGMDFQQTVNEVHPSLGDSDGTKSISNDTIESLAVAIQRFREVKIQRMQRLQDLATSMLELWNLMDTPIEEQQMFQNVTCNIAASEHEIKEPNMLSVDFINYVEAEVSRLEELKASKMKELVFKKRSELEEICRKTHMIPESDSAMEIAIEAIETGAVDAAYILEQIELQIGKVKEEALSRKEILEKVEKWMVACEEECWLEEYNRDDNRYNAGRGAHLTLKRAEKARALVNKLPGMVETLALKITAWENERGTEFSYDGVRLLSMLEEYNILRQEKEQERKRQRDQKKLQGQLIAEQEALFGSKPSPMKPQSVKKGPRLSCGGGASNRRLSLGGAMLQTPKADPLHSVKGTPNTRQTKKNERRVAARSENHVQFSESTTPVLPFSESTTLVAAAAPVAVLAPPVAAQPQAMAAPVSGATPGTELKKKRGRPRKYGSDGKPAVALSPMPISASIPLTADYSTWKHNRGQPIDSYKKKHKLEFESPGERVAYSVGSNFTPHVITVNAGEDVTMKIISFSQQGSRAICILAANGAISNVTLRQPNSSGGTLTYEGRFEILSLSGSFMPTDSGGTKSRTGGMSVSLAGPDGRVLGGGIAGLLVAAGPVQVVIGSFLPGHQQEQKPKKQKFEFATAFSPVPANHISGEGTDGVYSGTKPNLSPASYHRDNLGSGNPFHGSKVFGAENNVSLPGESKDLSPTKCMVFC